MPSEDFSKIHAPDSIATLFGLRAFKVDHTGHLNSIYFAHVWTEGLNAAICQPPKSFLTFREQRPTQNIGHDDWLTCQCGYYGYTNGWNTYLAKCGNYESCGTRRDECKNEAHRTVSGVVEAWGRMIVGPKGFRAEKVAIRGLAFEPGTFGGVSRNYPNLPVFPTVEELLVAFPLTPTDGLVAA